jgi:hypothetical protein
MAALITLTLMVPGLNSILWAQHSSSVDSPVTGVGQSAIFSQITQLQNQARAGKAEAQAKLGDIHFSSGDYTNAARLYYQAARQGFAEAQLSLATCYAKGLGVPQSNAQAEKWARLCLAQGAAPKIPAKTSANQPVKVSDSVGKTEAKDSRHQSSAGNSLSRNTAIPATAQPVVYNRRILTLEPPAPQLLDLSGKPTSYSQIP